MLREEGITIGNYPDISLPEARKRAREQRAEIDLGADPAAIKRTLKAAALCDWTVSQLIKDYREKFWSNWRSAPSAAMAGICCELMPKLDHWRCKDHICRFLGDA